MASVRAALGRAWGWWAFALALLLAIAAAPARAEAELTLRLGQAPRVDVWPAVQVLEDTGGAWTVADVQARRAQFEPPRSPARNLGPSRHPVWLRIPLRSDGSQPQWLFDVNYPPLQRLDLYLVRDGQVLTHTPMGLSVARTDGGAALRTYAAWLDMPQAGDYTVYLRVFTGTSLVLPMALYQPAEYHAREGGVLLAQGMMIGVALALLVYSLAHWASLRNRIFAYYALMVASTLLFFGFYAGTAQQQLGLALTGWLAHAVPLTVLLALVGGCRFMLYALAVDRDSPRSAQALKALSWAAGLAFAAGLLGVLDYPRVQLLATVLGPMLMLLSVPLAWKRARAGDRAGGYMLAGWCIYFVGAITMAGLARGGLPANAVTLNLFQWTWAIEMLAWLRVLALHVEAVRQSAEAAEAERRVLQGLALTDALTGLPNRRGLQAALDQALPLCQASAPLAVYLLDLDGFKLVNDQLGHDAGDRLLVQVGERLKARLRRADVVARLGGDEFVVMAAGLADEAEAQNLGRKLLEAFEQPFMLDGRLNRVGATIGFAMAPHDGREAGDLLRRADAAMYAGKQAGRQTLRRGGASAGLAA